MHSTFASKFQIQVLSKLGFCSLYPQVQNFEHSAAVNQGMELPPLGPGQMLHLVGDNADYNLCTLDGTGTFHGMGIIPTVTPGEVRSKPVPRVSVTADEIKQSGKISIK